MKEVKRKKAVKLNAQKQKKKNQQNKTKNELLEKTNNIKSPIARLTKKDMKQGTLLKILQI